MLSNAPDALCAQLPARLGRSALKLRPPTLAPRLRLWMGWRSSRRGEALLMTLHAF